MIPNIETLNTVHLGTLDPYLQAHGTYEPLTTGLVTLLVVSMTGLICVSPMTSRVITPVISSYEVHEPPCRVSQRVQVPNI